MKPTPSEKKRAAGGRPEGRGCYPTGGTHGSVSPPSLTKPYQRQQKARRSAGLSRDEKMKKGRPGPPLVPLTGGLERVPSQGGKGDSTLGLAASERLFCFAHSGESPALGRALSCMKGRRDLVGRPHLVSPQDLRLRAS